MAKTLLIKTLAVAALVCLVVDLAASEDGKQYQQEYQQPQQPNLDQVAGGPNYVPAVTPTPAPNSFKDKLKGFVSSVKEGASDALESVSDAAHSFDEKRKEVVAGSKKLVNGAIEKIKNKYDSLKNGDKDVPRVPSTESSSPEEVARVQSVESQESIENGYKNAAAPKPAEKH